MTVLGNEFAGQVEEVGPAVTHFAVGDRVFGYDYTACGAHAEYPAIAEDASLALIPPALTYTQAAPHQGSHYAFTATGRRGSFPDSVSWSTAPPVLSGPRRCSCWPAAGSR